MDKYIQGNKEAWEEAFDKRDETQKEEGGNVT